jgi:hypothetical protein
MEPKPISPGVSHVTDQKRKSSPKQVEANRQNRRKSNGPCTRRASCTSPSTPSSTASTPNRWSRGCSPSGRIRALTIASLRPANPHQRMQVEDIAHLRCEKLRLRRARLGLIAGKMHGLEWERDRRVLEFDYDAPDLPQAELLQKGLDRVPDSAAKFEKMLACFDVLIDVAKQGQFALDPEPELNLLYGQEPSLDGAYLRNVFRRFVAAQRQQEEKSEAGVRGFPRPRADYSKVFKRRSAPPSGRGGIRGSGSTAGRRRL